MKTKGEGWVWTNLDLQLAEKNYFKEERSQQYLWPEIAYHSRKMLTSHLWGFRLKSPGKV